ncbi:MAG: rhomboid family intramembrane serine protease [Polaromonas sp.]|uniref:rhomboid family intramembrane serine protease n=1 Tax=Polaromonas sp. TaxID=1869339 RepID=UPI00181D97EE|nr:rhomboid family intramembrane serine protease [Polaromonas sp.]NMM10187.1 rhomboid family intramembrane serine protease [Polaromonas sp.]
MAAFFVLMTLGLQLWPGASEWLRFSRPRYEQGAVWQIWTSQWVHLSNWHAVGNAFAFLVIILMSGYWIRWPFQMLALVGGYVGVAIVVALDPSCNFYAGASGALHGLLAGNAVSLAWPTRAPGRPVNVNDCAALVTPSRGSCLVAITVLGGMALKLWLQAGSAGKAPLGGWGFPVYHPAHVAGALGGMSLVLLVLASLALTPTKEQAESRH